MENAVKITRDVKIDESVKPMTVEERTTKEKAIREFYAGVYANALKLLNRNEETHVSNITINAIIKECQAKGDKTPKAIIERLDNCKPAKSVDDLLLNIRKGYVKGTRTDGVDLDFTGIQF